MHHYAADSEIGKYSRKSVEFVKESPNPGGVYRLHIRSGLLVMGLLH